LWWSSLKKRRNSLTAVCATLTSPTHTCDTVPVSEQLGHHCGVVGIFAKNPINMPASLFYPLYSLQHRGQEAAGIAYQKPDRQIVYKDLGLVGGVLAHYLQEEHFSNVGIGHARYSTSGGNSPLNVQPIHVLSNKGEISLGHNGNISNAETLKEELFQEGAIFQGTTDTELILHMISRSGQPGFLSALKETLSRLEGAFSIVIMYQNQLIVARDAKGFRPLYVGSDDEKTVVVSETCGLDIIGIKDFREVEPGELLIIGDKGTKSEIFKESKSRSQCVFEFLYFARPDSQIFGRGVYPMRKAIGAALAEVDDIQGDLVIPVPDSGNAAALGYAKAKGLPFEMGLTRNHFAGRSFTLPSQAQRETAVKMKLSPIPEIIQGKSIILVDDSLVRGTTAKIIVKLLRYAGAKEIHLRLCAPELRFPCFYGIDIPTRGELISNRLDNVALAKHIGADSVRFVPVEQLKKVVGNDRDYCFACFSGEYPEPLTHSQKKSVEL
jgi:amidophosphoribosyltransferase